MPLRKWELDLLGGRRERRFTQAGVREFLQEILFDLDADVAGQAGGFARVLLQSMPYELSVISVTFRVWDDETEQLKFRRFYSSEAQNDLDADEMAKLERDVEKVILPTVSDTGGIEGTVIREFGGYRVTYTRTERGPTRKDLHSLITAFEESGRNEATVVLRQSRSIKVEDGPPVHEDEAIEVFLERLHGT